MFPLMVEHQRRKWREKDQRDTRWLPAHEAASAVDEPELRALIERFFELGARA